MNLLKIIAILTAVSVMLFLPCPAFAEEENILPYTSDSKAVIVTECNTGQILFQRDSTKKLPMASVTKLMCMLIWAECLENGTLSFDDIITASAHANSMDGSVIWLMQGEKLTAGELIKSVVIASANDATVALCEHIAGSEQRFVTLMNEKAKALGMNNTNYVNCVGFDDDNHYTTAYDIALLCAEISQYSCYDEFFGTRLDYVREGERATQLLNTNKLMRYYKGILGGKTGTTDKAGCCLAVWAGRGDMTLCAVTLGCSEGDDRFDVCESLLDYGFNGFTYYKIKADIKKLNPIPVQNGLQEKTDIRVKRLSSVVIPKGSADRIEYYYEVAESLTAPVQYGQKAGYMTATLDGELIFSSDIITVSETEELTFFKSLLIILSEIFKI